MLISAFFPLKYNAFKDERKSDFSSTLEPEPVTIFSLYMPHESSFAAFSKWLIYRKASGMNHKISFIIQTLFKHKFMALH